MFVVSLASHIIINWNELKCGDEVNGDEKKHKRKKNIEEVMVVVGKKKHKYIHTQERM